MDRKRCQCIKLWQTAFIQRECPACRNLFFCYGVFVSHVRSSETKWSNNTIIGYWCRITQYVDEAMLFCVFRLSEHAGCHASLSPTPSDLQYHEACFTSTPHDVHSACRSVTFTTCSCTENIADTRQLQMTYTWLFFVFLCPCCLVSLLAAQTMGPRPTTAAAAAAPPVRGVPQYKYAAGVRNPQQHMTAQPQVTMQQVWMHNHIVKISFILAVILDYPFICYCSLRKP